MNRMFDPLYLVLHRELKFCWSDFKERSTTERAEAGSSVIPPPPPRRVRVRVLVVSRYAADEDSR
jgi:hypothetical protein